MPFALATGHASIGSCGDLGITMPQFLSIFRRPVAEQMCDRRISDQPNQKLSTDPMCDKNSVNGINGISTLVVRTPRVTARATLTVSFKYDMFDSFVSS